MSPKITLSESKKPKRKLWPPVRERIGWNGKKAYLVDLGKLNGKRVRYSFSTKDEADTCAQQERIKRTNEGMAAFSLPANVRAEAAKCQEKLSPHGVSLTAVTDYYLKHVIAFQTAPKVSDAINVLVKSKTGKRRERTVEDLTNRLERFSKAFGARQLSAITSEELEEWLIDPSHSPRTIINYATKISQLYNFAIKKGWAEINIVNNISRPDADDKEAEIFTVKQAKSLLEHAGEFKLLPYVAFGLFAGLRSAELLRLDWSAVKYSERAIIVGAEVAKKRSRRVVEINDTLASWIAPYSHFKGAVTHSEAFRDRLKDLMEKLKGLKEPDARVADWPQNGLRHSYGSYHLAMYGDAVKTANLMGHQSMDVIHNHYKALVLKTEAESFWNLRPDGKAARIIPMRQSA